MTLTEIVLALALAVSVVAAAVSLIEPAHTAGARIDSNSWGTVGMEGQYTVRSRRVDLSRRARANAR